MADICETGMDLWPFASLPKGVLMGWPKPAIILHQKPRKTTALTRCISIKKTAKAVERPSLQKLISFWA